MCLFLLFTGKVNFLIHTHFCFWHVLVHGSFYTFPSNLVVVQNKEKNLTGIVVFSTEPVSA